MMNFFHLLLIWRRPQFSYWFKAQCRYRQTHIAEVKFLDNQSLRLSEKSQSTSQTRQALIQLGASKIVRLLKPSRSQNKWTQQYMTATQVLQFSDTSAYGGCSANQLHSLNCMGQLQVRFYNQLQTSASVNMQLYILIWKTYLRCIHTFLSKH